DDEHRARPPAYLILVAECGQYRQRADERAVGVERIDRELAHQDDDEDEQSIDTPADDLADELHLILDEGVAGAGHGCGSDESAEGHRPLRTDDRATEREPEGLRRGGRSRQVA